ncbi:putative membrane protein YczE [Flavimobilis soli]|uniref:Putative membrane protein YczE n=1 Tax=Flavimobilis soli TaxID=442709 RepID=A0A2A9EBW0_9MICO|nr:hypothetical protein [Flavimobilis soli]PFG35775.1 putative membrane protein YczE [Flavimobilis soli]
MKIDHAETTAPAPAAATPGMTVPRRGYLLPRLAQLVVGLTFFGLSISLVVHAGLGVSPWDVLAQGLALATGWTFGLVTCAVGALVLLAWWPLRTRPGLGTVLNVIIVGLAADLGLILLARLPDPLPLPVRIAFMVGGIVILAVASGAYLAARLGPGPRDGLMTGLHDRFGWPIAVARAVIELSVLGLGWALGGDVGIGTLTFALLVGPLCGLTIPWFAARAPWLRV